ncbi:MAG: hypothetical protein QOC38_09655 [Nitrososphaeraceae archaeon]|nr:hypothetical protein [Nitrososphaeraceae archaeon]MDW0267778.1 hypothetical protein [Nitrososphaeraceae archaeon]
MFNLNHTALNQSYLEVTGSTCASAYEVKDKIFQKHMKDGTIDLFHLKPLPIDWLREKVREQVKAYEQGMNE